MSSIGFIITARSRLPQRIASLQGTWLNWLSPMDGLHVITDGDIPQTVPMEIRRIHEQGRYIDFEAANRQLFRDLAASHHDWIMVCDDDTFVWVDRLRDLLKDNPALYLGCSIGCYEKMPGLQYASGGAGIVVRRECVVTLASAWNLIGFNDVAIGDAAVKSNIPLTHDDRFHWAMTPDDYAVTVHYIKPKDAYRLYEEYHARPAA